jgi:hypothetical protein
VTAKESSSRARRARCVRLGAAAFAFAMVLLFFAAGGGASPYRTPEFRMLMQIKEISPAFGESIERMVFEKSFSSVEVSAAVTRLYNWIIDNKYPRIAEFLNALDEDDAHTIFELFQQDTTVTSAPDIPLCEDLGEHGQYSCLTTPFHGELYVLNGHESSTGDTATGPFRYAWDFTAMRDGQPAAGEGKSNEDYFVWGHDVLAPADGTVIDLRHDAPDHLPGVAQGQENANFIRIDHGDHEYSTIRGIQCNSAVVSDKKKVARAQLLAKAGNNGDAKTPMIHYQLDHQEKNVPIPIQARFAVYFAREENQGDFRLVVSGIPKQGQYIMDVESYIDLTKTR